MPNSDGGGDNEAKGSKAAGANARAQGDMTECLIQARDLALQLDMVIVRKMIDATLLEVGYQIAARMRADGHGRA